MALAFGKQTAHGRNLAHLDGVAVEAREDAVQAEHVTVIHQQVPAVEIAAVRLASNAAAEPLKVALDGRAPFLQAVRGQADGEPAVQPPGPPFGAVEVRRDGPPGHFKAVTHTGKKSVELLVAQVDLARKELADAGLANAAEAGQAALLVRVSRITSRSRRRYLSIGMAPNPWKVRGHTDVLRHHTVERS